MGASDTVTVVDFLPFKLLSTSGGGNAGAQVKAIYIGQDSIGNGSETTFEKINLKAEISWPAHIQYSLREKEIYSIMLFQGGNLNSIPTVDNSEDDIEPDVPDNPGNGGGKGKGKGK